MLTRHTYEKSEWIDLFDPTADEIREVIDTCDISPNLAHDLSGPVPRSEVTAEADSIKVILNFPVVKLVGHERPQEIKFLITKERLITVRYADIASIHQFAKEFEVTSTLDKTQKTLHGGEIFVAMMKTLYTTLTQKLDYMEVRLTEIEERMFDSKERELVVEISHVSQRLVMFRQSLIEHEPVLAETRSAATTLFGNDLTHGLRKLESVCGNSNRKLTYLTASAVELRETNNALLTTKQNEIMKTLTIMAFVTFPLSLFASLFGMNTETLPIVGTPGDFWYILGFMILATAGFFAFFKYKRWM